MFTDQEIQKRLELLTSLIKAQYEQATKRDDWRLVNSELTLQEYQDALEDESQGWWDTSDFLPEGSDKVEFRAPGDHLDINEEYSLFGDSNPFCIQFNKETGDLVPYEDDLTPDFSPEDLKNCNLNTPAELWVKTMMSAFSLEFLGL